MALRQRLEGVTDVAISQYHQTIAVTFTPGTRAFSPPAFRSAVAEAEVEVVRLEIDACGVISETNGQHWITTAGTHFLLRGDAPDGGVACFTGRLNDQVAPYELEATKVSRTGFAER